MTRISDFVAGRAPPQLYETYLVPALFRPWAEEFDREMPEQGSILDIACGTGIVARTLAKRPASRRICAIDVAPAMIDLARAAAEADGTLEHIRFDLAGADALPFADNTFDAAICQQGLQFFPDKPKALREMERVLKPGGQAHISVWTAAPDGNPVIEAIENAIAAHLGADLVPTGPFAFGAEAAIRGVFGAAGLTITDLQKRSMPATHPDIESFVLFDLLFLGRPGTDGQLQPVIDPADPKGDAIVAAIIADMSEDLAEFIQPDGTVLAPTTTHVVKFAA